MQLDGATTVGEERILVVGATNRPQELDDAARRRLVKRLYIPLPDQADRLLSRENSVVSSVEMIDISQRGILGSRHGQPLQGGGFRAHQECSSGSDPEHQEGGREVRGLNTSFLFNNKVLLQADPAQRPRSCPEPGQGFCEPTGPGALPGLGQEVRGQQVEWDCQSSAS